NRSDGLLRRHISSATLTNTTNSSPIRGRNRSPHRTRAPVGRVRSEQRRVGNTTRFLLPTTHQRDSLPRSHIRRTTLRIPHSTTVSRRNRSPHSAGAPVGRVHEEQRRLLSTTRVLLPTSNRSDGLLRRHISSATLTNTTNSSPIRGRNRSPHRTRAPVGRVHKEQRRRLSTDRKSVENEQR